MIPNISLTQLRCFAAVADKGSFTLAAETLCLTQSAVSQAVKQIETTLGAQLLARAPEGVGLTAQGRQALPEVRAALAALERLGASTRQAAPLSGSLRLGVVQSAAIRLLPGWMRRLRILHPGISLVLYEGTDPEILSWVLSGVAEAGICSRLHPDLTATEIFRDAYVAVVPVGHDLAGAGVISLEALTGQKMLLSGGGCESLIEELLTQAGSTPDIVCMVRDNTTLLSMVREKLGLTIVPELALPTDLDGLVVLRLQQVLPRRLSLLTPRGQEVGSLTAAFAAVATAGVSEG